MKVLITGITGFVGSHLADYILTDNPHVEVHGTRRYHLSKMDNVNHIFESVHWHDCNLKEAVSVRKMIKSIRPDIIFHMAAESFVSPSWDHPTEYMDVNYGATVNVLDAVREFAPDCVVHLPGSGEEYGEIREDILPIDLETVLNPVNPYAVSKIAQDLIGYVYFRSYGTKVVRTRAFNHEGPRRHYVFGIPWFAYQIARIEKGMQDPIIETGDIDDKRNFTDVRDMVQAYWLAANHCDPGELYLVGREEKDMIFTFRQTIDRLIELSELEPKFVQVRQVEKFTRRTQVPFLIADISKFNSLVNWTPKYSMDDILLDTLNYWRDRLNKGLN